METRSYIQEFFNFFAEQKRNRTERKQTKEEAQVYDRHNFIGHLAQQKLLNSQVLIVGLSGCNTELAKNLVLSGANVTIMDDQLINEKDVDTNFFFAKPDIGKNRGDLGAAKLIEINPLVKIIKVPFVSVHELHQEIIVNQRETDLNTISIIATSTYDFDEIRKWDQISKSCNIPYYNLICCGLYGFIYISLGREFSYEREKQIVQKIVFGQKFEAPKYKEFEQVTVKSVTFDEALKEDYMRQGFSGGQNEIYYAIIMMAKAQQNSDLKKFDAYDLSAENQARIDKIVQIGVEVYKKATKKEPDQKIKDLLRNFTRLYGVDFCPTYSVLGSVASQEFIVTISTINEPAVNWFTYDSQSAKGFAEVVQDKNAFQKVPLTERQQLLTKN